MGAERTTPQKIGSMLKTGEAGCEQVACCEVGGSRAAQDHPSEDRVDAEDR